MSIDIAAPAIFPGETAAERILREHADSGAAGYRFAPGITIQPPSHATAKAMEALVEQIGDTSDPTEDEVMSILSVLMGDQFDAVIQYLDEVPISVYPLLFADLFENLLKMVPKASLLEESEEYMTKLADDIRLQRPDLFPSIED